MGATSAEERSHQHGETRMRRMVSFSRFAGFKRTFQVRGSRTCCYGRTASNMCPVVRETSCRAQADSRSHAATSGQRHQSWTTTERVRHPGLHQTTPHRTGERTCTPRGCNIGAIVEFSPTPEAYPSPALLTQLRRHLRTFPIVVGSAHGHHYSDWH